MFIVNRCYDYDGNTTYNANSIVGIYDDFEKAKQDLIEKITKMKYEYEVDCDSDNYFFIWMVSKNGKNAVISKKICYEIIEKNIKMNEIKFKS